MKFSFPLLKKLVPEIKDKEEVIRKLNLHFFETEDVADNVLDVSIPPNRFSDAASHWGIAAEISAILGKNFQFPRPRQGLPDPVVQAGFGGQAFSSSKFSKKITKTFFEVKVQNKNLCPRYVAQYFENIKIGKSPDWMQKVLIDCGLRPINNVVDIMNYVMLETGQPLHAFDYDKLVGASEGKVQIIIRRAEEGEKIATLDGKTYKLDENILVIADGKNPLAIAGMKGGEFAEVDAKTKKIIVESANFSGVNIYKTSKKLKLSTDASLRFSHNISPALTIIGLKRTCQVLTETIKAEAGQIIDVDSTRPFKEIIKFDLERFNQFSGLNLDVKTVQKYLERLGFKITENQKLKREKSFLAEPPVLRRDVELFEDVAEEVLRLYDYNKIKSQPPHVYLHPSGFEDQIVLKNKIKRVLVGIGLDEVSNYSFISQTEAGRDEERLIELENPISAQFKYLRPSLASYLIKNLETNFRFFDEIKIFEIGKIFKRESNGVDISEKLTLGIALTAKNKKEVFFELKGLIKQLFGKIGLVDYLMPEADVQDGYLQSGETCKIESDGLVIGYFGRIKSRLIKTDGALAEIDLEALLKLVVEEHEYKALPKYPSIMRDISILVESTVRVGEIVQAIQESDLNYIDDVDLIDEYEFEARRSLTFRIIFQAEDRTLTDKEVGEKMEKIVKILKNKFSAETR